MAVDRFSFEHALGTIQHTGTLADFRQHYDYLRQPGQELTLEDIIVSVERRPLDENAIV